MGREVGGGTRVHPWQILVDVWQNQYNIVKKKKKNLLHSTGNLIQCSIITYMGKESDKE